MSRLTLTQSKLTQSNQSTLVRSDISQPRTRLLSLTVEQFEQWQLEQRLQQAIRDMSLKAIASGTFTCTACGEQAGYYIITTGHQKYYLPTREAYLLLRSMIA